MCEGDFCPRLTEGKCYYIDKTNCDEVAEGIKNQQWKTLCINENCVGDEFNDIKKMINDALYYILPEKSSFEK